MSVNPANQDVRSLFVIAPCGHADCPDCAATQHEGPTVIAVLAEAYELPGGVVMIRPETTTPIGTMVMN